MFPPRAGVAQLVEHLICNQVAGSSSLSAGTIFRFFFNGLQGCLSKRPSALTIVLRLSYVFWGARDRHPARRALRVGLAHHPTDDGRCIAFLLQYGAFRATMPP